MPSDADYQAAAAARRAEDNEWEGPLVGRCNSCGRAFEYGIGTDVGNLDPSPCCGSDGWEKVGTREEISAKELGEGQ